MLTAQATLTNVLVKFFEKVRLNEIMKKPKYL